MLDKFKKLLNVQPAQAEVVETREQAVVPQAELDNAIAEFDTVVSDLQAQLKEATTSLDAATVALAELNSKYEAATAALAAIEAEKAEMIAQAAAAKAASRKEKVVAAIGTEKADSLLLATEGLDDAAFEAVVSALVGSVEVEAKSNLFKEVGVAAQADATKVNEESAEMKILLAKYGKK
jgi:hypothetical protein